MAVAGQLQQHIVDTYDRKAKKGHWDVILQIRHQLILPYPLEDWHDTGHSKIHWHQAQFVFAHIPLHKRLIKGDAHYLWKYFHQATEHAAPSVNGKQDYWQHPTCDETG